MSPGVFLELPNFTELWSWMPNTISSCLMFCLCFLVLLAIKRMVIN